jgi:glycosyltransferase involved in cell wall biosynthesis
MKLSFCIPAYNEEINLRKCLESISKETAGKDYAIEIIVANNASTDRTKDVALSFSGVNVIDEPHKGIVWARRAAYLKSTGDLIANIDADTILTPGWIETVFREFSQNKKLAALSGPYIYYDLKVWQNLAIKIYYGIGFAFYYLTKKIFGLGAMLQGGNFIITRETLEKIGGYDTSIEFYGEDTDIARRVEKIGFTKFTFKLPMLTTGRRLAAEGFLTMGLRYGINYLWTIFFKKPFTKKYQDIRQ